MSYSQDGNLRTLPTATDLSTSTGLGVVKSGSNMVVNTTAGGRILGVLVDDPVTGQSGTYQIAGVVKVKTGAAVADQALLVCNASGKFITGATTGHHVVARALEAASATDQFIAVELGYLGII